MALGQCQSSLAAVLLLLFTSCARHSVHGHHGDLVHNSSCASDHSDDDVIQDSFDGDHNSSNVTSDTSLEFSCDDEMAPLFLSPLISTGRIGTAKELARVKCFPGNGLEVESYSGYTVDEPECQSNLFFWFFPAQVPSWEHRCLGFGCGTGCVPARDTTIKRASSLENPDAAPVILWLNGGPFRSSTYGTLLQHGPWQLKFKVNPTVVDQIRAWFEEQVEAVPRDVTWTREFSVLYVDNPVGAGASFSDGGCYSRNMADVSSNLHDFLQQFFVLFAEYSQNDFYIGGQSYAGKYVPALGHHIHQRNQDNPQTYINLKGIFLGAGFCDPETMLPEWGEYLFTLGIASERTRRQMTENVSRAWSMPNHNPFHPEIRHYIDYSMFFLAYFDHSLGNIDFDDLRKEGFPVPNDWTLEMFLKKPRVARALHLLPDKYEYSAIMSDRNRFGLDFLNSTKPQMAVLMDLYKVLYYTGNMDVIVNVRMGEAFLLSTPWSGQADYSSTDHTPWTLDGQLAGYRTTVRNFTRVIIRNAGHNTPADQPEATLAMIRDFINGPSDQ